MNCRRSMRSLVPAVPARTFLVTSFFLLISVCFSPALAGVLRGAVPHKVIAAVDEMKVVVQNVDTRRTWTASVNTDGTFELADLPAGRVIVLATTGNPLPEAIGSAGIGEKGVTQLSLTAIPPDQASAFNFVLYKGEYYNNKPSEETADIVTVTGTNTTANINIGMSPAGGTISGHVTVDGSGTPIQGIVVVALGLSSFISSFDRTDASGNYTITGIPAGDYLVSANMLILSADNDYVGEYFNNVRSSLTATPVHVTAGANTPNINFGLGLGGSISGRILSGVIAGQGLPYAAVTAHSVSDPSFSVYVLTGSDGTFRIRALPAGSYTVEAEAETYISEYYDDAPTALLATPVLVTAGQDRSGVDITLTGGGRIQGTVRNQNTDEPLPGYLVTATNLDPNNPASRSGITDASGTYTIEGLNTGNYAVGSPDLNRWYDNKSTFETATPVSVTVGSVVPNIDISGIPDGAGQCTSLPSQVGGISGTVSETPGGATLANVQVSIYSLPTDPFPVETVYTGAGGAYTFGCLDPGTYYVEARSPFTRLLPVWYGSGAPQGVTVVAGSTHSGVNLSMASGGAISGRVTIEGTSTGIEGVEVTAKNTATQEEYSEFTGPNGDYLIDSGVSGGLPPGSYKVRTDDYSTARLAYVPVELSRFTASWTSIGVVLEWTAGDATDYSGFHVLRSSGTEEPIRLTTIVAGGPDYSYTDTGALPGEIYEYWLVAIDRAGEETRFGPIAASPGRPAATRLIGASPNPVTASAVVRFSVEAPGRVTLRVFDLSGRLVRTLADGVFPPGMAAVSWNARSETGEAVPAGAYYLELQTPQRSLGSKMIVVR